ncbi:nucleoporin AMO1-like [Belonocnema kinseyi]|uniref:nucleoporin AMO1-like n=1 Tax=Belonocnema kinseyi TaxID=2817044 RepID=UPI00143DF21A|nr:nucleoporin AMO1-like [Belonocnema kinseyi]
MVVCKYFQQGSCRFGQYCRYEHANAYAQNVNRNRSFDGKNIALVVAEDVLASERGGQWLFSCFGPFKEQPSIPGMEDLSPEEVRWEMYQAEKKGTADQVKLQFQQLCQEIKAKRERLKNPTSEIVTMLENLQKPGQETAFGTSATPKPSNFSFAPPQLGATTTSATSSVFGGNSFGTTGNPFGGSFNSTGGNGIFGAAPTTNTGSMFGSKPSFGSNPVFGSAPSTTSLFGGATKPPPPAFGAQTTQNFGTSQTPSVFGGGVTAQPVFGQSAAFGTTQNNSFLRSETTQASSVFGSNAASTFGSSAPPSFGSPGVFGNSGGTSVFGSTTTPAENSSVFGQPKTTTAFGAAPVFGGTSTFGGTQPASVFGGQTGFGSAPVTTSSIFGGSTTSTTMFGSAPSVTGFGTSTTPAMGIFGGRTQAAFGQPPAASSPFGQTATAVSSPFGQTTTPASAPFGQTTTAATTPFGQPTTAAGTPFGQTTIAAAPFATTSGPFGAATSAPFSQSTPFGQTVTGTDSSTAFGNITPSTTHLASGFGVQTTAPPPFGAQINFGSVITSPFATGTTTVTATPTNPFMATPQTASSPFATTGQTQNTFAGAHSGPFGKPAFGGFSATVVVDESIYTAEGLLTDDEKSWYLQERFSLGKIPLKAPTKELR